MSRVAEGGIASPSPVAHCGDAMAAAGAGPDGMLPPNSCWRPVASKGDPPLPRSGAASAVVGNRLYIFGGYGGGNRLHDFHMFDFGARARACSGRAPSQPAWRSSHVLALVPRDSHAHVVTN